ncbi:MAG: hypothetical protein ACLTNW_17530 [Mediterraneibacter gnavus]
MVIKYNANICTDGISAAMFKDICKQVTFRIRHLPTVPTWQAAPHWAIFQTQVALNTVDIGLPQLAMHSPYETAGVRIPNIAQARPFLHRSVNRAVKKAPGFSWSSSLFHFVRFQTRKSLPTHSPLPVIWLTVQNGSQKALFRKYHNL